MAAYIQAAPLTKTLNELWEVADTAQQTIVLEQERGGGVRQQQLSRGPTEALQHAHTHFRTEADRAMAAMTQAMMQ
jgi:hypothetical protein